MENKNNKTPRHVQKLPKCFWGSHQTKDNHPYVYFFDPETGIETITSQSQPTKYKKYNIGEETKAWQDTARANEKGKPAIMWAYDATVQQSVVVVFSEVGVYADMIRASGISYQIAKAQREVFPDGCPKTK